MTTLSEARDAVYRYFYDRWASLTPVVFMNEPRLSDNKPYTGNWVTFTMRHETSPQDSFGVEGNRKYLRRGIILMQVFVPAGVGGSSNLDPLLERIQQIFEGGRIVGTTVRFFNVDIREVGEDGDLFQTNVDIMFEYEQVK